MKTLENKIRELNREILRLKTSHPMSSGMKTFWGEYTLELEQTQNRSHTFYFEITYVEGAQPILTNIMTNYNSTTWIGMMVLESPSNNKQILAIWSAGWQEYILEIIISSSRQILGVRRINTP